MKQPDSARGAVPATAGSTAASPASPRSTRNAVALAYRTGDPAPKVVASGRGLIAEEIIARAREHGVFVHESRELVALLMQVDLDRHIPPALYTVVAELLAWLYHIDTIKGSPRGGTGAASLPGTLPRA